MSGYIVFALFIVFCATIGPILMLKPSPRQRAVAQLRQQALGLGLKVGIVSLGKDLTPVYRWEWPKSNKTQYGDTAWRLERKSYQHDIHLADYWYWSDSERPSQAVIDVIEQALLTVPERVKAVSADGRGLGCFWSEQGGESVLEAIAVWLQQTGALIWPLVCVEDEVTRAEGVSLDQDPHD